MGNTGIKVRPLVSGHYISQNSFIDHAKGRALEKARHVKEERQMVELTEKQKKEICGEYRKRKDTEVPREVVESIAEKYGISKGAVAEVLGKNGEDIKAICYGKIGRPKKQTVTQEDSKEMAVKATVKKSVTKKDTQEKKKFEVPEIEECKDIEEEEQITVDMKSNDKKKL